MDVPSSNAGRRNTSPNIPTIQNHIARNTNDKMNFEVIRIRIQNVSHTLITNMFKLIYIRFKMKNCSNKQNRVGKYFVTFQEFMHVNE